MCLHEIRWSVNDLCPGPTTSGATWNKLFKLQPRAAQKLLELQPTVQVGTSRLVERETLSGLLKRIRDADDTTELLEQVRREKAGISRKKMSAAIGLSRGPARGQLSDGRFSNYMAKVLSHYVAYASGVSDLAMLPSEAHESAQTRLACSRRTRSKDT